MPTMTRRPRARGRLVEFLEKIDVGTVRRGAFEELPHLVDDEQHAVTRSGVGFLNKPIDELAPALHLVSRPRARRAVPPASLLQGGGDVADRIGTTADDRHDEPSVPARLAGV
jgi:hypothetical protein